jgi:hypothetical protein
MIPRSIWLIGYSSRQAKREIPDRRNSPKQVNDDSRVQGWYVDTKWIRTIISCTPGMQIGFHQTDTLSSLPPLVGQITSQTQYCR